MSHIGVEGGVGADLVARCVDCRDGFEECDLRDVEMHRTNVQHWKMGAAAFYAR